MIFANQLKPGTAIKHEGKIFMINSTSVAGTAQRRRSFHVKMYDLVTNQNIDKSFGETDKFEEPDLKRREVTLSYRQGRDYVFMDVEDYHEYVLIEKRAERQRYFLREGETYRLLIIDGDPVWVELPTSFTMTVLETAPPTNSAQGSSALKDATVEGGLVVKVPPFIKTGEKLKISTDTYEYQGKAQG